MPVGSKAAAEAEGAERVREGVISVRGGGRGRVNLATGAPAHGWACYCSLVHKPSGLASLEKLLPALHFSFSSQRAEWLALPFCHLLQGWCRQVVGC